MDEPLADGTEPVIANTRSPAESLEGCNEKGRPGFTDPTSPNAKGYFLDMAVVSDAGFSRKANSANFPLWRFEDLRALGPTEIAKRRRLMRQVSIAP